MSIVALFSGGKDSMYSIIKAREMKLSIDKLLFVIPTFSYPNPHELNHYVVEMLANDIGLLIEKVRLRKGMEVEDLAKKLREMKAKALVAGDILLEEHLEWHEKVCRRVGIDLIEPLFGYDTRELLIQMVVRNNIEFTIIAINPSLLENLLGLTISKNNIDWFLRLCESMNIDFLGERGEYHTLVNSSPILRYRYEYRIEKVIQRGIYGKIALVKPSNSSSQYSYHTSSYG